MISDPLSGEGASGGIRNRDRRSPADFRAGSQSTMPPTALKLWDVRVATPQLLNSSSTTVSASSCMSQKARPGPTVVYVP
ncbi:hypothetical protein PoB_007579200 [Plakobranchus ocellatus]|uniref:Uncharacterized protein n=1 Tax=Plakobranchus ocellatus TaxID=259542 RepID=A0AAV4DY88_9GAST|nr:hypothetical protein PoB_007579200 [Plakobranchus ocellatus]